jgi:hypothetical protein
MKKLIYTLSLALMASAALLSCSKGEYTSGDGQTGRNPFSSKPYQNPVGTFKAKINGNDFAAAYSNSFHSGKGGEVLIVGFKTMSYSGDKKDGVIISLPYIETGTFDLSNTERPTSIIYSPNSDGSSPIMFKTGVVVIYDTKDGRVKGGFSASSDGMSITSGEFDVPFLY